MISHLPGAAKCCQPDSSDKPIPETMTPRFLMQRLLLLSFLSLFGVSWADDCVASCEGRDPGDTVADPHDCHNYYGCLYDGSTTDTPFTCSDGYYYDTGFEDCFTEFDPCTPRCPLVGCSLTCQGNSVFLAYPGDCRKYRVCTPDGNLVTAECSADLPYFDGAECQTDPEQCCDPCIVNCNTPGMEVVDPYNCHNFYFCDTYYTYVEGSCGINMHFDPVQATCVSGRACENVCPLSQTTTSLPTTELTTTTVLSTVEPTTTAKPLTTPVFPPTK